MSVRILTGDCRDVLAALPDESVHCVVTSPPYWGLRDYGVDGQLGLERSLGEHVAVMVEVFREVRRVLRKDGTLWLNYGDSYATTVNGRPAAAVVGDDRTFRDKPMNTVGPILRNGEGEPRNPSTKFTGGRDHLDQQRRVVGNCGYLKPKDLCGIPWRVAFALQDDGWYLRQDIIWHKPNPMPESIRDRCTKAHEYLFLLAKSPRYYFDQEAIKEPVTGNAHARGDGVNPKVRQAGQGIKQNAQFAAALHELVDERNKRSVWTIPTAPYSDAHFATFPPALIEPCIKAGTSERGCCVKCGAPWVRQVERTAMVLDRSERTHDRGQTRSSGTMVEPPKSETIGWSPSCKCDAPTVPATVLDCFGGAGTTGLVADRLQRNAILIELNPEYAAMARKRIEGDAPLFASVDNYDGHKDFAGSYDACLEVVRERVAEGGPGWIPKEAAE